MAATIIVETGAQEAGANSFLSLVDARTLAEQYGVTLPADDNLANISLINGTAYICSMEQRMMGSRVSATQSLCYPRTGVEVYGFELANDVIPEQIKCAQLFAAVDFGGGGDAYGQDDGRSIASETVAVLSVSYFDNGATGTGYEITRSISCLTPLFNSSALGNQFNVNRG